jgi:predicted Zn-dependent peptidase
MKNGNSAVQAAQLPNGLVVITECMPHVHSVAIGIWIRTGSRAELAPINGMAHFIEHMVFKSTERRNAEEIARESDRIGGMLDAYTTREMVSFNTRVLDEHLPQAFDLLADLALHPRFAPEELDREKSVILEEIKMVQDNPEDLVHEVFAQNFWPQHPLGRPILGTPDTVGQFDAATLRTWFERWYCPANMVVTAAGNISHERILDLVTREFAALKGSARVADEPARPSEPHITHTSRKELEQVQVCLGVPSLAMTDSRRFAGAVLSLVLGSGMSSRLFQNIREKQGLAYAIFSEATPYRDTGVLSVYAGTSLGSVQKLVQSVMAEFHAMKESSVTDEELARAKDHLKGSLLLSLDSTSSRMASLARQQIYFGRYETPEELIRQLECVTAGDVCSLANEIFDSSMLAASVVGNLSNFKIDRSLLVC